MDILDALKREETSLALKLAGIRTAIAALNGHSAQSKPKRHVMSAEARAKISKAQKARWAKAKK